MEYFGQIIIFFAALIAIKGNTWDESKSGIKKLTTNGWLTMILALIGLIVSCVVVYQANRSSKVESLQLSEALQNTKDAKKSADSLRIQLK
jgi:predicted histidine transporter YuiF (NhaC family)